MFLYLLNKIWGYLVLWLALSLFLLCAAVAEPHSSKSPHHGPTLRHAIINGYNVYLVNLHRGNGITVAYNVHYGLRHDLPKFAGGAHLLEHIMFGGSEKYPGAATIYNFEARHGAEINAMTALNQTYYYISGLKRDLSDFISVLGAMMSKPQFSHKVLQSEVASAGNEISDNLLDEETALEAIMYIKLLPEGHPFASYELGTPESIARIPLSELQRVYYANYIPGNTDIIIAGNFSSEDEEAQTLREIESNFLPPSVEKISPERTPSRELVFPAMIPQQGDGSRRQHRIIKIRSKTDLKQLELKFELPVGLVQEKPEACELLLDYLRSKISGSFIDKLLLERGWITNANINQYTINNITEVSAKFDLTEAGYAKRYLVPNALLATLRDVRINGLSPEVLRFLKRSAVNAFYNHMRGHSDAAEFVADLLVAGYRHEHAFHIEARYRSVTQQDLQYVASQFSVDKLLVRIAAPNLELEKINPEILGHAWAYKEDDEQIFKKWRSTLRRGAVKDLVSNITFQPVDVEYSSRALPGVNQAPRLITTEHEGTHIVLSENHEEPLGAIRLHLLLPRFSPRFQAAFEFFIKAFTLRYDSEDHDLTSRGVTYSIAIKDGYLDFNVSGNSRASLDTLAWVLERFRAYAIDVHSFETYRDLIKEEYEEEYKKLSADIAEDVVDKLLQRHSYFVEELLPELSNLNVTLINQMVQSSLNRADIYGVFHGDYNEGFIKTAVSEIRRNIPLPLTESQRRQKRSYSIHHPSAYWININNSKTSKHYGIARNFDGPPLVNKEEVAAMAVLARAIHTRVYSENVIENKLGYSHRAYQRFRRNGTSLLLKGQTEGRKNIFHILNSWNSINQRILQGVLSPSSFEDEKKGVAATWELQPNTLEDRAEDILEDLYLTTNPRYTEELKNIIPTLTSQYIYDVGRKYLLSTHYITALSAQEKPSQEQCGILLLDNAAALRRHLVK